MSDSYPSLLDPLQLKRTLKQEQLWLDYFNLLHKWNQSYSLTALRTLPQMFDGHLLDSLSIAHLLDKEPIKRLIDIGTGAGLPGIPLAIYFPDKQFVLLDSNGKKMRFLTHVVDTLQLKNVHLCHGRSEKHRDPQGFDAIICRAVASAQKIKALSQHLRAPQGQWFLMKGPNFKEEMTTLTDPYQTYPLLTHQHEKSRFCIVLPINEADDD